MSTTITGHLIQDPHPTDESRVVSVDPNARTGRFRTIQHAVDYVRSRASAANPYIIRLMPGIYSQDVSIDASSMAGVQWVGAGRSSTVIYGTAAWVTAADTGATGQALINMDNSSDIYTEGFTVDAGVGSVGESGLTLGAGSPLHAISNTNQLGKFVANNMAVLGLIYSWGALSSAGAGQLFEVFNSHCQSFTGIRAGGETWHMFSCSIHAEATPNTTKQTGVNGLFALQVGYLNGAQPWQLWGCHIHAESSMTPAGDIACLAPQNSTTLMGIDLMGCTMHIKTVNGADPTSVRCIAPIVFMNNAQNVDIHATGCQFLLETAAYTGQNAVVGGVASRQTVNANNKVTLTGCDYIDRAGSGGRSRGALVVGGVSGVGTLPTVRVVGGNFPVANSFPSAQTTVSSKDTSYVVGTATLASGVARVLLVTDAGNVEGAAAMSFTNGNVTVSGSGTTFLTTFRAGDFVRAASHLDDTWTRIKSVGSDTSLTLEEGYRGATLATTQGRKATSNESTYWSGTAASPATYRVSITPTSVPTATDKFYVTAKHASGFTITSLDATSTAVVDYILKR